MVKQTKFKLVVGLVVLALAEGLLKTFVQAFPLTTVLSFQSGVTGFYFGVRVVQNIKGVKYAD